MTAASEGEVVLEVSDVDVSLGGRQILDGVTFSVSAGQFTGLIGSNGAGKTTLLRVILGFQDVRRGQVLVAGHRRSRRARAIGYVPQKVLLEPDLPLRARDVIALGLDGHRLGIARRSRDDRARVDAALEAVDAVRFADSRIGELSGGEQQRILIAHALISDPQVLLLDEPLANLDLRASQGVVELLDHLATEHGVAVVLSAHEMNPLLPVMDQVVYLADGRSVAGTTDEVIRTEVLSELYRHHVEVVRINGRVLVVAGPGADAGTAPDVPAPDAVGSWAG